MDPQAKDEYIKIDEYRVQVPVIGMEHQISGTKIDLIGAIHIASPRYYDQVLSLLQQDDIVLYELCGGGEIDKQSKDKLLFCLKMNLSKFYRKLAQQASNYYGKTYSRMNSILSKIDLTAFDATDDPAVEKVKNDLKDVIGNIKQQAEILNADVDVQLVYQCDKINYINLPDNRKHADMTRKEIVDTMKVFSLENMYFLLLKITHALISKYFMKYIVEAIINGKLDSSMASENRIWREFHKNREEALFRKIHAYEDKVDKIGIFYGAGHLKSIEEHLVKSGYIRKNISYMDSIRKYSKSIEESDANPTSHFSGLRDVLT